LDLVRLNINSDSIKLLEKHPYIRWNLAKAIVNYRKQHGDYVRIEDLNQMEMMNDSLFDKLYPYLRLD
jgi:DNA uptake protein ComE-like DNA-binding protein